MEERRQALEISRVRRDQTAARRRDQRDVALSGHHHGGLTARASQQLQDLYRIQGDTTLHCNILLPCLKVKVKVEAELIYVSDLMRAVPPELHIIKILYPNLTWYLAL